MTIKLQNKNDRFTIKKIHVLHVIRSNSSKLGGPSESLKNITQVLADHDVNITVATTRRISEWQPKWNAGKVFNKNNIQYIYFQTKYLPGWAFSFKLWRWLQHNITNYDLIHIHGVFTFPPLAACYFALKHKTTYIIRPAGTLNVWSLQQKSIKKRTYYKIAIEPFLSKATSIHATSQAEKKSLALLGHKENVAIVPLGISLPSQLKHGQVKKESLRLLFLSRIHPVKNLPLLLHAISKLAAEGLKLQLTVAGTGTPAYLAKLRNQTNRLRISDIVNYVGFVEGFQKERITANADIFVLPSFQESFGVAVVEAMAMGLPVIISDQVAIAAEIANADAGSIVDVNNVDVLVSALRNMQDFKVRKRMGVNARNLVENCFSLETLQTNLINYYCQILRR